MEHMESKMQDLWEGYEQAAQAEFERLRDRLVAYFVEHHSGTADDLEKVHISGGVTPQSRGTTIDLVALARALMEPLQVDIPGPLQSWGTYREDAQRYRHLKEHHAYYYPEDYANPQPREFGIQWAWQDITTDRPCMDFLIDQEIAAAAQEGDEEDLDPRTPEYGVAP
jgi:hypothetical protein